MKRMRLFGGAFAAAAAVALLAPGASAAKPGPVLVGRAVLPVDTYAPGPTSGNFVTPQGWVNGVFFPTPSQPVEGFSAVVAGDRPGEYLAMPDNGYGGKNTSPDFLLRAYRIAPDFRTARGGTGTVNPDTTSFLSFSDPHRYLHWDIVNAATPDRLLTGKDLDPESLQRAVDGTFWMGDEFGPWLLHFGADGVLLHEPYPVPGSLVIPQVPGTLTSPNNPFLAGAATHPNSRGFEAIALAPDGRHLYAALEGPTAGEGSASPRRYVLEFDTVAGAFTGRVWHYAVHGTGNMIADMAALDEHRLALIERDGTLGAATITGFRSVYAVDLRRTDTSPDRYLVADRLVDLTRIPDPALISSVPIHAGDLGIATAANPYFTVTCESIEAVHVIDGKRLLLGCDNNFPNKGRNPDRADDNEFIVVEVTALKAG